jgi:hypothetical protein
MSLHLKKLFALMAKQPSPSVSLVDQVPSDEVDPVSPIKRIVTNVLQLPPYLNKVWDIIDYYPNKSEPELVLAHYNDNYDPYNRQHEPLRRVRGIIVDLNTKAIVADSYGYTQNLPCYGPLKVDSGPETPEGELQLQTEIATFMNKYDQSPEEIPKINLGTRSFSLGDTKLFLGYEGAMARIFKWNGDVFFSTHRKINAIRSNWGGRTPFYELYQTLNGPPLASLFGEESYSPYCYMFLVVDDAIRIASSTRDNRVIFIGVKKVWNPQEYAQEGGPYEWSEEFKLKVPEPGEEPSTFSTDLNRAVTIQPTIDPTIANKFLFPHEFAQSIPSTQQAEAYDAKENEIVVDYNANATKINQIYFKPMPGKITDDRLVGGDFVILYHKTSNGHTLVYRLEPTAFEYRIMVTGNDPNLYHRFVVEMVNFTKADPAELRNTYPRYDSGSGKELPLNEPENRQVYWWSLFYDAVPPSYREEVDKFLNRYNTDLHKVANFIMSEYPRLIEHAERANEKLEISQKEIDTLEEKLAAVGSNEEQIIALKEQLERVPEKEELLTKKEEQSLEELKRVNKDTQYRVDDLRGIATNASYRKSQSPYVVLRGLLMKETGPSLYKMITTVRNIGKYRNRQNGTTISLETLNPSPPQSIEASQ